MIIKGVEDIGFGAQVLNVKELHGDPFSSHTDVEDPTGSTSLTSCGPYMKEIRFVIHGMTCANCSTAIEKHLTNSVEGIKVARVNLLISQAYVEYDRNTIRPRQIMAEISDLGFDSELQPQNEKVDLRDITRTEVQ